MTHSSLTNGVQITSDSSARPSRIDRFIVHHAATTSLSAILSLFQPGGRTVSANYALGNDGTLVLAVDEDRRAWTSSSEYWDGRAVTIECANSIAGGSWPVSDATFDKLARLIADVASRYGFPINDDTILTHQELYIRYGDSYATSCPGDLQRRKGELIQKAKGYQADWAGGGGTPIVDKEKLRRQKEDSMYIRGTSDKKTVYNVYSDANGKARLRVCGTNEAAYADAGGLVITGTDSTLTNLAKELGYVYQQPNPLPRVIAIGEAPAASTPPAGGTT